MGEKLERFKSWFFKVRIENAIKEEKRIGDLWKEYNDGRVLEIGGNGKDYGRIN